MIVTMVQVMVLRVRISRKNIYHELYHEILSVVQRMVLDDIPSICAR